MSAKGDNADALLEQDLYEAQLKEIESETAGAPLVGPRQPISSLVAFYNAENSAQYFARAQELSSRFSEIRYIRRDGNCFYRALLVAEVEKLFADEAEFKRFNETCREWLPHLLAMGFPSFTTTDFCDVFYELLESIAKREKTLDEVLASLNDDSTSNYYVTFLRLVTSGYLRENEENFSAFLDKGLTVTDFCAQEIEPMFRDVDHVCIASFVQAFGFVVRIEYMDQTAVPNQGRHYDFGESGNEEQDKKRRIHVLYRPGHYDLLYE